MLGSILSFLAVMLVIFLVFKLLSLPFKIMWKLFVNAVIGFVLLLLINFLGGLIGLTIEITWWKAVIVGIFGVPGIVGLLLVQLLL